ncbi:hypothetical protein TWF730_004700 [Orbilia blumenaviensis]|uniref:Uncharacterized protein n=1 Tax=Orbilia blumenaviensis TaxID=1796055 RepID=A0AAV9TXA0_9PEZI
MGISHFPPLIPLVLFLFLLFTPDLSEGDPIPPSIFYESERLRLACPSHNGLHDRMIALTSGTITPSLDGTAITTVEWNTFIDIWISYMKEVPPAGSLMTENGSQTLARWKFLCQLCLCEQETGRVLVAGDTVPETPNYGCRGAQALADKCALGFGCICVAKLKNLKLEDIDEKFHNEGISKFKEALMRMPRSVRLYAAFRRWYWWVPFELAEYMGHTIHFHIFTGDLVEGTNGQPVSVDNPMSIFEPDNTRLSGNLDLFFLGYT